MPATAAGDIVLFYRARGRDRLISWLTHSPYFHVALCCAPQIVVEAVPKGVRRRDLRDPSPLQPYVVIPGFAEARDDAVAWALAQVGDGYDKLDVAVIVLHRLFRLFKVNYVVGDRYTCGELVAAAYEHAGRKLFPDVKSEDVLPADFARLLPEKLRHAPPNRQAQRLEPGGRLFSIETRDRPGYMQWLRLNHKTGLAAAIICALMVLIAQPGRSTAPTQPSHSDASVPAAVRRVAEGYGANVRGVLGMQRHFSTTLHGGPIHRSEQSDSGQLLIDGTSVKIKFYRIVDDGRTLSDQELADRDEQTNKQWSLGKVFFKEPYDARYLADYTFQEVDCADCAVHTVAVNFTSTTHDSQHGQGTMWIDTDRDRVEKLTYIPNAMPPHATSGSVTETVGEPLPGFWYVTHIEESYQGHALLFKGAGTFSASFDHFRRFPTPSDGEVALKNSSI